MCNTSPGMVRRMGRCRAQQGASHGGALQLVLPAEAFPGGGARLAGDLAPRDGRAARRAADGRPARAAEQRIVA